MFGSGLLGYKRAMENGGWKWAIIALLFFALAYGGLALSDKWRLVAVGVSGGLMIVVWLLSRAGKLPDDADARAEYEHDMQHDPGESALRVWLRRFLWHL